MDEPLLSSVTVREGESKKNPPPLPDWDSSVKRRPASGSPKKRDETEGEKRKSIILNVCLFILITEFCERLAYYGLSGSLIAFFVKKLNFDKVCRNIGEHVVRKRQENDAKHLTYKHR